MKDDAAAAGVGDRDEQVTWQNVLFVTSSNALCSWELQCLLRRCCLCSYLSSGWNSHQINYR